MSKPTYRVVTYEAECDCGWWKDGRERKVISRLRREHLKECHDSITRFSKQETLVWMPGDKRP